MHSSYLQMSRLQSPVRFALLQFTNFDRDNALGLRPSSASLGSASVPLRMKHNPSSKNPVRRPVYYRTHRHSYESPLESVLDTPVTRAISATVSAHTATSYHKAYYSMILISGLHNDCLEDSKSGESRDMECGDEVVPNFAATKDLPSRFVNRPTKSHNAWTWMIVSIYTGIVQSLLLANSK
ncbi:hypothetical protein EDD18DRAFT_1427726 [Armillaria luteobubalina]|uniref:Uncharacterized protein n=1 Tax=Armillaria luteobubalina TaxID=153913 RepID=A0AA39QIY3_9AGAR|nr:hypothetical protein EDD18DRAFT_1427726 [Armillaria luteobubalina]